MKLLTCLLLSSLLFTASYAQDKCASLRKEKINLLDISHLGSQLERLEACGFDSIEYKYMAGPVIGGWLFSQLKDSSAATVTYGQIADLLQQMRSDPDYQKSRDAVIQHIKEVQVTEAKEQLPPDYTSLCETPKYAASYEHALSREMRRIPAYFDYAQALACARTQHKKLLVYFTGFNCVNCYMMERKVLVQEPVLNLLREHFIVASLYADGKVNGDEINHLQEKKFSSNTQPTFIIVNEKEKEIGRAFYDPSPENFIAFLKKAVSK